MGVMRAGITALGAVAAAAPAIAQDGDTAVRAIALTIILVLLLSSLFAGWQIRGWTVVRYAAIWVVIGLALVVLYAFRPELSYVYNRVMGAIDPARPMASSGGGINVRKSPDGHFHVTAKVNGESLDMLVDTGASTVVIPVDMARDVGIDVSSLRFDQPFETANGRVLGATFRIKMLEIGGIVRYDVRAAIVPDLNKPLLGMSFFNTLSSYEVRGDTLTFRD